MAEHHLSHLFGLFAQHRIKINMMQNMAISFSVCVTDIPERIENLIKDLENDFKVIKEKGLELITIRHYKEFVLDTLLADKMVLFEERIRNTVQFVVKEVPKMKRKES